MIKKSREKCLKKAVEEVEEFKWVSVGYYAFVDNGVAKVLATLNEKQSKL